jgi:LysR family glycine cleavage system transcriptional activator
MAGADIAAGRLMTLSPLTLALGHPYGLAYPRSKGHKRQLLALVRWLSDATPQTGP